MTEAWMHALVPPVAAAGQDLPCRTVDPELFFSQEPDGIAEAKAVCADCPSRTECLTGALERLEPWGVWGGELFLSGVVIARKRGRGRPRKDAVA